MPSFDLALSNTLKASPKAVSHSEIFCQYETNPHSRKLHPGFMMDKTPAIIGTICQSSHLRFRRHALLESSID